MSTNTTVQLPFTTSHAFIVGINDYQHLTPLSTAVNDAKAIAQRLADQHDFMVHPPLLDVTHADLRKLLAEDIPQLVGKEDRVLFYFAGHGIALDGEEGPNGHLVAADTRPGQEETLIPMQLLHDALTGLPCRHGLLVLDCCFSGAFKWSSGYRDVIFDLPKVIYEERFWRYCKDEAWQVITSSAHDQKAVDIITNQSLGLRGEERGNHSPFAASLLEALSGAGDVIPAGQGDGVMTATEIYSYLRDSVENETTENAKRQSPSIFNLQRHDKGEFIFLNPVHRFNLPPTPDRNPFMGLSSYNEDDATLFFGRDRVVSALLETIKANNLTVVSGASGTGKSSVIKAGVLPRLRKEGRTILPIIRPGKEPMQTIATELPHLDQQLAEGAPVLIIDQYEELITQCLHPEDRLAFEQQIAKWLKQYPELDIILSIRSDFEPQFESEVLKDWWAKGRYIVPSFSLDEVREVITRPAAQAVLFYEPEDLVERISEEVSQAPGALPLLSFTLSELYHGYLNSGRQDRALAEEDYKKLGGVIGALRTRADAEYDNLQPAEQTSMRKLMLRMVSTEGGELAGKRVYSDELHFTDAAETERMRRISDQLVDARLLLKGKDGQGRTYVEPAHDALVRAWGRLYEWIKLVGEDQVALQGKLGQAVVDYNALLAEDPKKARNLLWNNNPRLPQLHKELSKKGYWLNAREEDFVRSSIQRRKTLTRRNWSITAAVTVALALLSFVGYSFFQDSQIQTDRANENELDAKVEDITGAARGSLESDHLRAFRLAELGYSISKQRGKDATEFADLMIRALHDKGRFHLSDDQVFTKDELDGSGASSDYELVYEEDQLLHVNRSNATRTVIIEDIKEYYETPTGDYVGNGKYIELYYQAVSTDAYQIIGHELYNLQGDILSEVNTSMRADYDPVAYVFDGTGNTWVSYNTSDGGKIKVNGKKELQGFGTNTTTMAISIDGKFLAIGSSSGIVRVYDLQEKDNQYPLLYEFPAFGNGVSVHEIAFGNGGQLLMTSSYSVRTDEGTKRYWSMSPSTFDLDYSFEGLKPEPKEVTDPHTKSKAVIDMAETSMETEQFSIDLISLKNQNGESLISFNYTQNPPYTMFEVGLSDDSRYLFAEQEVYPLDPEIILAWINEHKVLGELADIDLSQYTDGIPAELLPSTRSSGSNRRIQRTERANSPPPAPEPAAATTETKPEPEPQRTYGLLTGDNVFIRATPVSGTKIMKVREHERVEILGQSEPQTDGSVWYQISYQGKTGWMTSKYIRKE